MLNDNNAILLSQLKQDPAKLYTIKTSEEIEKLRAAGKIAAHVLEDLGKLIKPGVTTRELEKACRQLITEKYGAHVDRTDLEGHDLSLHECFTFTRNHVFGLCDVDDQPLKTGEIIGMDVSIKKDGWAGDTSRVWIVGDETSPRLRSLLAVAYEAMWVGIRLVKPGVHLGTIAHEVQKYVENQGFSID